MIIKIVIYCLLLSPFIIGIIWYIFHKKRANIEEKYNVIENIDLSDYDEITVNFNKVKVTSHSFHREYPTATRSRAQAFNTLLKSKNETTREYIKGCSFKVRVKYNDKYRTFKSENIGLDKVTFQFLGFEEKTINIYVNKTNKRKYFIDLSFLEKLNQEN